MYTGWYIASWRSFATRFMFSDVGDMRYMAGVSGIGCRLALMLKWTVTYMTLSTVLQRRRGVRVSILRPPASR